MSVDTITLGKVRTYAERHQLWIGAPLGSGTHGNVFIAEGNVQPANSAVKVHKEEEAYHREFRVYERLLENQLIEIEGFHIPQLLRADDELLVIEMTIVEPPFLLDFGGAYLDRPPEFPEEVWA